MTEEDSIRELVGAVEWVVTTHDGAWEHQEPLPLLAAHRANVWVRPDLPRQVIDGIGGCFNELGWTALTLHDPADRGQITS